MTWREQLGPVGVWRGVAAVSTELAVEVERLGFGAIWLGGSPGSDLRHPEALLDATATITIATGIVNIWSSDAAELAASFHRIEARHPGRLLLGIGTGHREATAERTRPLDAMQRYLDVLDESGVPRDRRVLSALGPKMLAISAERSAGTHPYLTIPRQTAEQREALGPHALVAPEQTVVLDTDPASARASARGFLANYLRLVNYTTTMRRGGFSEDDVAAPGTDHLVDAIVRHGDAAALAAAARAHLDEGADHVCLQVVPAQDDPLPAYRAVAAALGLPAT
ncbi:LLM class F420-dependent oxidoreductase [Amnibacterium kyonggiense]|uniref:Putative F420-dependent oxidoreductase n=1 Tax=Amnibacterium kyonggiense TaxID=595671 RepID=A0A4R7FDN9_9MICO|nr:LLM class F420-dependent oxidoreductase [Amnibacterium kyonggiense]TDS75089.1 putative F420-dependent oxidoreductase [Amnibacterium kyonggiense]